MWSARSASRRPSLSTRWVFQLFPSCAGQSNTQHFAVSVFQGVSVSISAFWAVVGSSAITVKCMLHLILGCCEVHLPLCTQLPACLSCHLTCTPCVPRPCRPSGWKILRNCTGKSRWVADFCVEDVGGPALLPNLQILIKCRSVGCAVSKLVKPCADGLLCA